METHIYIHITNPTVDLLISTNLAKYGASLAPRLMALAALRQMRWTTRPKASAIAASKWRSRSIAGRNHHLLLIPITGVGNCPILGILDVTSPYSNHYRPYTQWLGDVQWGHLMTHVLMDVSTIFSIWKIQGAPHTSIVEVGRAWPIQPYRLSSIDPTVKLVRSA